MSTLVFSTKKEEIDESATLLNLTKYEDSHIGNFRRIYPENNEEEYQRFFENSCSLFQETAASKARSECARLQREKIKAKKEEIELMRRKNCGMRNPHDPDGMRPESGRARQRREMLRSLARGREIKKKVGVWRNKLLFMF